MAGPYPPRDSRTERGFTLLELLVVIVLIGLGASFAQLLVRGGSGMELRTAARGVARHLRSLRQQAIRRQIGTSILVNTTDGRVAIDAETDALKLPDGMNLIYEHGHDALVDQPVDRLMFFPDGSSSGGSLVMAQGASRATVHIAELDGEVTVDD